MDHDVALEIREEVNKLMHIADALLEAGQTDSGLAVAKICGVLGGIVVKNTAS